VLPAQEPQPRTDLSAADEPAGSETIVVTARKREETLQDVPIAITAVAGDTAERRGVTSVRDIASLVPGLNVTSDGVGRAFVAIRGIGVTIVQSVQPGVGLFVDGIYKANTSYLNNPIADVERIEVLRGPQGTLYGRNTLGGAINLVSRQPGNELRVRGIASYAGPDRSRLIAASVSGPIVADRLQARLAVAHSAQDGFLTNPILGIDANPLTTDTIEGTVRMRTGSIVTVTVNAYHDRVDGTNTPYARVTGTRDYSRLVPFNTSNRVEYLYRGVNARLEADIDALSARVTLIGAYDRRDGEAAELDGDISPLDLVRASLDDELSTRTGELRVDIAVDSRIDLLLGLFHNRETSLTLQTVRVIPTGALNNSLSRSESAVYAGFGTLFWRPGRAWEVSAGLRYTHEDRDATGSAVVGGVVVPIPPAEIEADEFLPRLTVTRRWTGNFMSYASVARGYRGGGFNSPLAPLRTYRGDTAWTYELGTRFTSSDGDFYVSGAMFYNDYDDYIGLNSVAPSPAGGFVSVDLNTGDVESYGIELEAQLRPAENWRLTGNVTYAHARLTDTSAYTAVTGRVLASRRLPFQPDWNVSIYGDHVVPIGADRLTFTLGLVAKGSRIAASLNQTTPTVLDEYLLVNAVIGYVRGPIELSLFADNLFGADYFESYVERTSLELAGQPPSDIGITGDGRRVGARARLEF
jgi:iron complex outermembrane receptor protein